MRKSELTSICRNCGKEFPVTPSILRQGSGKSCSQSCSRLFLWKQVDYKNKQILSHKGKSNGALVKWLEKGNKPKGRDKGCIAWNFGEKMPKISGRNHYLWVQDRTQLKDDSKDRGGQLHREWSKQVKNRDKWTCRIADNNCDGRLEAHHILGWSSHPELRYEVNNGITLCHFHHPRKTKDEMKLSPFFQKLVGVKLN